MGNVVWHEWFYLTAKERVLDFMARFSLGAQQVHDDGKLELSARYMLEGTDGSGKSCLVFIENVGIANVKGYIEKTHPKIRTNSTTLSWLETSVLLGTISAWEKGVIIHIYLSSQ